MRPKQHPANFRLAAYIVLFAAVIDIVLAVTLEVEGALYPLLGSAVVTAAVGVFFLLKSR